MKLLRELSEQMDNGNHIRVMEAIDAAFSTLMENKRGGKITPKGSRDFFNSNSKLVIGAAAMAISANRQYQLNKKSTFTLHAKDAYERRMITQIVDALTRSRKFKIARTKFTGQNKTWVLKPV